MHFPYFFLAIPSRRPNFKTNLGLHTTPGTKIFWPRKISPDDLSNLLFLSF
jgi:hypothetical protein